MMRSETHRKPRADLFPNWRAFRSGTGLSAHDLRHDGQFRRPHSTSATAQGAFHSYEASSPQSNLSDTFSRVRLAGRAGAVEQFLPDGFVARRKAVQTALEVGAGAVGPWTCPSLT